MILLTPLDKKKKRLQELELFIRTLLNTLNISYEERTTIICDIHNMEIAERGNTKIQISHQG